MKINLIGTPEIIMSNPDGMHKYFGWPSVARLQNGKIAVAASGFRRRHICPFGKAVISYSEDEGKTYTRPAPVIDTVLDDRDAGVVPFGKSGVIVTSFNNSVDFQRGRTKSEYDLAYLDSVTPEEEEAAIGSTFKFSNDCGVTFGKMFKSPITSPHGPLELKDGSLLWVGRTYNARDFVKKEDEYIRAYKINLDGTMEFVGEIEQVVYEGQSTLSCEPHTVLLDDGTLVTHIRVQDTKYDIFTLFQSVSYDNGKTWTKPEQLLSKRGGAPSHLIKHSSGMLIATYGFRSSPEEPNIYGIRAMFSTDNGKTWDKNNWIYKTDISSDLGYPATVELKDGSLLTVFYALTGKGEPAVIMQQKWTFEEA